MKKTLLIAGVLWGTAFMGGCFFDSSDGKHEPPFPLPNYLGSIYINQANVFPFGLSATNDGSLLVTAAGTGTTNQGQIWSVGPTGTSFSLLPIDASATGAAYRSFTSHALQPDKSRMFACSTGTATTFPTVVVLELNTTTGGYDWKKVMNFPTGTTTLVCGRIVAQNSYIFVLNTNPKAVNDGATYFAPLSATASLPATLTVGSKFITFGFTSVASLSTSTLTDMKSPANIPSSGWTFYLLDNVNHAIDKVVYTPGTTAGTITMLSFTQQPFDASVISNGTAFVSVDDSSFLIAQGDNTAQMDGLYKVNFDSSTGQYVSSSLVSPIPVPVVDLGISPVDRFRHTTKSVAIAVLGSDLAGGSRVDEYAYQ